MYRSKKYEMATNTSNHNASEFCQLNTHLKLAWPTLWSLGTQKRSTNSCWRTRIWWIVRSSTKGRSSSTLRWCWTKLRKTSWISKISSTNPIHVFKSFLSVIYKNAFFGKCRFKIMCDGLLRPRELKNELFRKTSKSECLQVGELIYYFNRIRRVCVPGVVKWVSPLVYFVSLENRNQIIKSHRQSLIPR